METRNSTPNSCCGTVTKKKVATLRVAKTAKSPHPDHGNQMARLNRVVGQVDGVKKMIEGRRYCPEILAQTRAVASALKAIELNILERHIRHCVSEALVTKNSDKSETKIKELISVLGRF